ncbi:hypothetical protein QWY14_03110 [Planococcus sp. N028]|uniref:Ig-like domain-containing protein n=1 Tax=Planococcus shixiaomingii TaxID=3058393 RepID=A0ABT8MYR2_9BACL|nr:hypothetical protein [Planococcus sp. N028]MDN7240759.1 hypothetical protein [Planococcus sp. N028]
MKKNEKFSIIKLSIRYLIPGFLLFAFGSTFIMYALDLKAVITNQPSQYAGKCEIMLEYSEEGEDPWLTADFDENFASFDYWDYPSIEAGTYYCEVEYFPSSSEGIALNLYRSKGEEALKIK